MTTPQSGDGRTTGAASAAASVAAATLGLLTTVLVSGTSLVDTVHRSVPIHVAIETTAALVSLFAAVLVHGRFRSTLQLRDLLLVAALGTFAATNLLFAALPAFLTSDPGSFRTWAPTAGTLLASLLLAAAPFTPERILHRPRFAERFAAAAYLGALSAISLAVLAAGSLLPPALSPSTVPQPPRWLHLAGHPAVLTAQFATLALFAAAAIGYGRIAARDGDGLARWLAVAATFGAFARLNYSLLPSLYTDWLSAGDALRLACFLCVFAGAVHEARRIQRTLATAAVADERRRIARDLHDGVTQDLAFIVQQARHIAERDGAAEFARMAEAAQRALDESRQATAALVRPAESPLGEALAETARDAAGREGTEVEIDVHPDIEVPARMQQELLRAVREAVINAARHGGARHVVLVVRAEPHLCISVTDDGRGFDPELARSAPGRFGLESMAARMEAIGGDVSISSSPGAGSEVRLTVP
jgi:signal transduction histidine kinase